MSYHYSRHNLMSDSNIFIAAKLGDSELLKDLLAAGHKINHRDKYGKSALHHAVEGMSFFGVYHVQRGSDRLGQKWTASVLRPLTGAILVELFYVFGHRL